MASTIFYKERFVFSLPLEHRRGLRCRHIPINPLAFYFDERVVVVLGFKHQGAIGCPLAEVAVQFVFLEGADELYVAIFVPQGIATLFFSI